MISTDAENWSNVVTIQAIMILFDAENWYNMVTIQAIYNDSV